MANVFKKQMMKATCSMYTDVSDKLKLTKNTAVAGSSLVTITTLVPKVGAWEASLFYKKRGSFIYTIMGSSVLFWDFQVTPVVKNPPANARGLRDACSIPESGRSSGGGHGNPLQYSGLENPHGQRSWRATVHEVAQSRTRLQRLSTQHSAFPSLFFFFLCLLIPTFFRRHTESMTRHPAQP